MIDQIIEMFDAVELGRRAECAVASHGAQDWLSTSGNVVCGVCRPPAAPELVVKWLPRAER